MQLIRPTESHIGRYSAAVAELVWSTGPASYGYQLGSQAVMMALAEASWPVPGTLFGHDAATLAVDGDELLGIEIGFVEPGFVDRVGALGQFVPGLIDSGVVDLAEVGSILERSAQCAWLNPTIPPDAYYLHSIAVSPHHRGKGIGASLLRNALDRARTAGATALHLDVLSDNPAVDFYRTFGLQCVVESKAPIPFAGGIPIEYRMVLELDHPLVEPARIDGRPS